MHGPPKGKRCIAIIRQADTDAVYASLINDNSVFELISSFERMWNYVFHQSLPFKSKSWLAGC